MNRTMEEANERYEKEKRIAQHWTDGADVKQLLRNFYCDSLQTLEDMDDDEFNEEYESTFGSERNKDDQ